jgi:hypothetical protein
MEARFWAEDGGDFITGVRRLLRELKVAFDLLHAIEFDAPWRERNRPLGH